MRSPSTTCGLRTSPYHRAVRLRAARAARARRPARPQPQPPGRLLDDIEQRGLVHRERDPQDRRRHASPSPRPGRTLLRRLQDIAHRSEAECLQMLSEPERRTLTELLGASCAPTTRRAGRRWTHEPDGPRSGAEPPGAADKHHDHAASTAVAAPQTKNARMRYGREVASATVTVSRRAARWRRARQCGTDAPGEGVDPVAAATRGRCGVQDQGGHRREATAAPAEATVVASSTCRVGPGEQMRPR